MKKILVFHPYLAPYRVDLYNFLAKKYHLKALFTGSLNEKKSLGFNLNFVNSQAIFDYSYSHKGIYLGRHLLSLIYFKTIIFFKPNIIIAHELGINVLSAILLKKILNYKIFITVDDSPAMTNNLSLFKRFLQKIIFKNVEAVLVVHPKVQEHLEHKYKSYDNCEIIYFPIIQNESKFLKKLSDSEVFIEKTKVKYNLKDKKVILFVGRLEEVKSPNKLLDAFRQLKNKSDCVLVFVGDGKMKESLKLSTQKFKLSNQVFFTGKLQGNELYAWFAIAKIFVLPSAFEPFGAVVNEALMAGCWVIVSDRVGANCLINESNGNIFKDDYSLLDYLEKALAKTEIRKKNINKMPFSFNLFVNKLDDLIKK